MTSKMIKTMDKESVTILNTEVAKAMAEIAEKHGLKIKKGSGTFDPSAGMFTPKFSFICETEDGIPSDFVQYAPMFGLKAEDFGKVFESNGSKFSICGIKPRATKYPILAKKVGTNNIYKFDSDKICKLI